MTGPSVVRQTMKALSVRQPWAWLLTHADEYPNPKRIENRSWKSSYRGPLLIHASMAFDRQGYESVLRRRPDLKQVMPAPDAFERGGVVGQVEMVGCIDHSASEWFIGQYGFVMADARALKFTPARGALSIFNLDVPLPSSNI